MKFVHAIVIVSMSLACTAQGQISVSLTPGSNADNRFIDAFSQAYAQVGNSPEGMYELATDQLVPNTTGVNAFPFDDNWANLGTLVLSSPVTPSSSGTFDIVGTTGFDINSVVDGTVVSLYGSAYSTTLDLLSGASNFGSVTLTNGVVTDLDFNADVSFAFPNAAPGFGIYDEGTLSITESTFTLDLDDAAQPSPASPLIPQTWDFDGTVSTSVVPEPGVGALVALGGLSLIRRRRLA